MSKKTTILTVIVAAVLLLAVVAIAMNAPDKTKTADEAVTQPTETVQQSTAGDAEAAPTAGEQQAVATIVYENGGFEPSSLTVKSGDTIRIENKSSLSLSFNSDDHPAHTDQGELNVGDVPQGGSREFTVTKTGTWGFHNHDNAAHAGKLIVQ